MKDDYTKLMVQQHTTAYGDAAFFEKLEKVQPKKRIPAWKVAVIAACVCLIIPGCVWAAETIFGVTTVEQMKRPTYDNKPGVGIDIKYENLEDYHIEDFSEHLQELQEYEQVVHTNWAEAEAYLGIDLLDNIHFTANDTYCVAAFKERGKNAQTTCWVYEDQMFAASVDASFERDQTYFWVQTMVSVDLPPEIKDDVYNYYHGYSATYYESDYERDNIQMKTEQYTTKAGIPVLILIATSDRNFNDRSTYNDWEYLDECIAFFAVNNVTYRVDAQWKAFGTDDLDRYASPLEKTMPALLEFLDGFVIE